MADPGHRNPFEGVLDYFSEVTRMRELGTHGRGTAHETGERTHASAWVPATDIFASGDDLVVRVEAAGVDPADVDISFAHGSLTISGVRRTDADEGDTGSGEEPDVVFYVRERFFGEFRRVINLPDGVDRSQIVARLDDGLVEVTVKGAALPSEGARIALTDDSRGPEIRRFD